MQMSEHDLWQRFQRYYSLFPSIGLSIDLSRMNFPDTFFETMAGLIRNAFAAMHALEKGEIANPDENRMVGHYWLRNSKLAPTREIQTAIDSTLAQVKRFAADVHSGKVRGAAGPFTQLLLIGIGGSALGPQFVAHALGQPGKDKLKLFFFDNTDPDGIDKVISEIGQSLGQTLTIVISKSGGTRETRNGMLEAKAAYERVGLQFSDHACVVTGENSELDKLAQREKWLARFPMWDWVGGRTSETSAVGLLPAALQRIDIDDFLAGAAACDEITRKPNVKENPAAQLALMWYYATDGHGRRDMVVLPYKDRLELFSKYLQQLVMESLGKGLDRDGKLVNQGLTVYGNKGSTDQHAYVQQLREGLANFFVVFIAVLRDREGKQLEVESAVTSGDYLLGFLSGTRTALYQNGRESITITLEAVSPFSVGALIALFERAVGFYASLVNVNAYHQPGVEAGKKAAENVIKLQQEVLRVLGDGKAMSVADLAAILGANQAETIFKLCEHIAANGRLLRSSASNPFDATYRLA